MSGGADRLVTGAKTGLVQISRPRAIVAAFLVGVASAATLASCGGPTRSTAAVCRVFTTDGVALHNQYQHDADEADSDPLLILVDIVRLPNQMADLLQEMANVAPTPINSDFLALVNYFRQIGQSEPDAVMNPLTTLGANLVRSVQVAGSAERVNSYLSSNCSLPTSTSVT